MGDELLEGVAKVDGLTISPAGQAWALIDEWNSRLVSTQHLDAYLRDIRRQAWELIKQHNLPHNTKVELGKVLGLEM